MKLKLSPLMSPLEPRLHFTVTSLAATKGLPRQLTAVGKTIYFARDTGVDHQLRYDAVIALDTTTGAQSTIRRNSGKTFADSAITLSSDGRRLFIDEFVKKDGKHLLWTMPEGGTTARLSFTSDAILSKESELIRAGTTTYFLTNRGVVCG